MQTLKIAFSQPVEINKKDHIEEQMIKFERMVVTASKKGAEIICFPNCYPFIESNVKKYLILEEKIKRIARKNKINILYSSIFGNKVAGTIISSSGKLIGRHYKTQLFIGEKKAFQPGKELKVFKVTGVKIGIIISYELFFPEVCRTLMIEGAEVIFNLSHVEAKKPAFWKSLIMARAIENQIPIVSTGLNSADKLFQGGSLIAFPNGKIPTEIKQTENNKIKVYKLDLKYWQQFRKNPSPIIGIKEALAKSQRGPYVPDINKKTLKKYIKYLKGGKND